MVPGTPYEEILKAFCRAGCHRFTGLSAEAWVAQRLASHRRPTGVSEQSLGSRWIRIGGRRTSDGGVVSLRTAITDTEPTEGARGEATAAPRAARPAQGRF